MLRVDQSQFLVKGCERHHVWLKLLESEDAGRTVSVAKRHAEYDAPLQQTVLSLSKGDVVEVDLASERESSPNWRFDAVYSIE